MDFGEYLVEIRDQLEVPLRVRVKPWRVFLAAGLEAFSAAGIVLFDRRYRTVFELDYGITHLDKDLDEVSGLFRPLSQHVCSREQAEQATRVMVEQMERRYERGHYEYGLWRSAIKSGRFLGQVMFLLPMFSVLLSNLNDHTQWAWPILTISTLAQALFTFICLKGWHRS